MARHPELSDDKLFEIATYLARPEVRADIHAELPLRHQIDFETEYREATNDYPLPSDNKKEPYYIWPEDTNKQGRELRIYCLRIPPEPPAIQELYVDKGKWPAKSNSWRINHSNLVMQLCECGFVLGAKQDPIRIEKFMRARFPVSVIDPVVLKLNRSTEDQPGPTAEEQT